MVSKVLLHIPHSSNNGVFDKKIGKWSMHYDFINNIVNRWTDWHADVLFQTDREDVEEFVFNLSRFVCDVERLDNDPLEEIGQGVLYTKHGNFERGILEEEQVNYLFKRRSEFRDKIKTSLIENSLVIDCHSFPSDIDRTCDICIGYNDDITYSKEIIDVIKSNFEEFGYSVKLNTPYSNSITFDTDVDYKSVMIEVNKRVYMNENRLTLHTNPRQWMRWYGCIEQMYELLLGKNS